MQNKTIIINADLTPNPITFLVNLGNLASLTSKTKRLANIQIDGSEVDVTNLNDAVIQNKIYF